MKTSTNKERPPIVAVMGHIDHGKSTLLDSIRKDNAAEQETGRITQHISAYEVSHKNQEGVTKRITFLDTPGHEAFAAMRSRGGKVADIGILVVAADDGVKAQTLDALKSIHESNIPFVVAINKIDLPNADVERTKKNLIENEIYLEGLGGDVPYVAVSALSGKGIQELLDMVLLVAEFAELKADPSIPAEGFVLESNLDSKKGISGTLIITNGTLKQGMFVVAGKSAAPIRLMEDFVGKKVSRASFSSPVKIMGFDSLPEIGLRFKSFNTKKKAKESALQYRESKQAERITKLSENDERLTIPVVVKADVLGTVEAVLHEIQKMEDDRTLIKIVKADVGNITEYDLRILARSENALILGFHTKIDPGVKDSAEQLGVMVANFDIIYKLTEWLEEKIKNIRPKKMTREIQGQAKVLKTFSRTKNTHVIGGRVDEGKISAGQSVVIIRQKEEVGLGKIIELQSQKIKKEEIHKDTEFGGMVESPVDIIPGDVLQVFIETLK